MVVRAESATDLKARLGVRLFADANLTHHVALERNAVEIAISIMDETAPTVLRQSSTEPWEHSRAT